jgi:hypothetical protein
MRPFVFTQLPIHDETEVAPASKLFLPSGQALHKAGAASF